MAIPGCSRHVPLQYHITTSAAVAFAAQTSLQACESMHTQLPITPSRPAAGLACPACPTDLSRMPAHRPTLLQSHHTPTAAPAAVLQGNSKPCVLSVPHAVRWTRVNPPAPRALTACCSCSSISNSILSSRVWVPVRTRAHTLRPNHPVGSSNSGGSGGGRYSTQHVGGSSSTHGHHQRVQCKGVSRPSSSSSSSSSSSAVSDVLGPGEQCDVVVIGAGIGGLSCAAMLAYYGFKVSSDYTGRGPEGEGVEERRKEEGMRGGGRGRRD